MKLDPVWRQTISEWAINLSVFVFSVGLGVYFAVNATFPERVFVLTADTVVAIVLLVLATRLRKQYD